MLLLLILVAAGSTEASAGGEQPWNGRGPDSERTGKEHGSDGERTGFVLGAVW